MPSSRPRASFEPIAPDFDLRALVENTPNFQYVDRISCDMIDTQGMEAFDRLVLLHVIIGGKPLVIDGYQSRLDPWTFSSKWLMDNHGDKVENARNLSSKTSIPLTVRHYLTNMGLLTDQFFEPGRPNNYRDKNRQRMYLKDIDCPQVWHDKLREHLPPNIFYLNESTGEVGGPGAVDEPAPAGGKRKGKGIAPAGDLMSSLPPAMRAENMMCYIGHEGTYTPAHREMCGSLGHNIMVATSDVLGDTGSPEQPGSSIWFMTEMNDRHAVSEYWLSTLGHDIEVEDHFAQIAAWKGAPFTVYVVEQNVGDFILIPPLAPHQVWNRGTRTMKAAWNRTTVETLELAMKEALPNAKMVCRDEQYKNKAIVYYTMQKYSGLLARARDQQQTAPSPQEAARLRQNARIRQLHKDFKRLFHIYKNILLSEMFSPDHPHEKNTTFLPFDSNVTCAYCRGNIFNRFLTCTSCPDLLETDEPEPYDVCMECYVMGRSCGCISKLKWVEQFKWKELVQNYENWRKQYLELEGGARADSPLTIQEERAQFGKKTLAQICQEQIKLRPWVDVRKPEAQPEEDSGDEEVEMNDDGTVKKTKKRRSEAWLKNNRPCHVCCHRHERWKMAECKCGRWWCYGTLFRAHDLQPQTVMEDAHWQCPHCKGVCSAGSCRRDPRQRPYEPKGTLLGHDTRKVADVRSVESLVDFSVSNLHFLKETAEVPADNARLRQRQEDANKAKSGDALLNENYVTEVDLTGRDARIQYSPEPNTLDPRLQPAATARLPLGPSHGRNADSLPAVTALLDVVGSTQNDNDDYPGYQPARQSGYIAPHAVMMQPDQYDDEPDSDGLYPDLDEGDGLPAPPKKRGRTEDDIQRQPHKKRRPDERHSLPDGKPVSGATKQFRKEQERKALEEARKSGRYIAVSAALKGRSRVVALKVGSERLANFGRSQQNGLSGDSDSVLVKSDITPQDPHAATQNEPAGGEKAAKQVRIRVERDDDFVNPRRGGRQAAQPKKPNKKRNPPRPDYEEVEIESGEEEEVEEEEETTEPAASTTGKGRRMSSWQARRHDDEDDLPDELPQDWKDGLMSKRDTAPKTATSPGRRFAQIRPSGARPTTRTLKTRATASTSMNAAEVQGATAPPPSNEREVNRRAKLEAAGVTAPDDPSEQLNSELQATIKPVATRSSLNRSPPGSGSASIMDRKGPGGRNVKIVSRTSRSQATGLTPATTRNTAGDGSASKSMFTAVNAGSPAAIGKISPRPVGGTVVQLSDEDEDSDESNNGEIIYARQKVAVR